MGLTSAALATSARVTRPVDRERREAAAPERRLADGIQAPPETC
jgi:hypothetical protein